MTKTEFKAQPVDDLRQQLLDLYDDVDGTISQANKKALGVFVDDNWDHIDSVINPGENDAEEAGEQAAEEVPDEEDEGVGEVSERPVTDEEILALDGPNPYTDLR